MSNGVFLLLNEFTFFPNQIKLCTITLTLVKPNHFSLAQSVGSIACYLTFCSSLQTLPVFVLFLLAFLAPVIQPLIFRILILQGFIFQK